MALDGAGATDQERAVAPPVAGPLVIVSPGSGVRGYREYALAQAVRAAAERGRSVVLLLREPATWQRRYAAECLVADLDDPAAVIAALRTLPTPPAGVMTWDEMVLETSALVAEEFGLPYMTPREVRACRDKLETRRVLAEAGVPVPQFRHLQCLDDAPLLAESLALSAGWPLVVKPRSLAASVGVVLAESAADVPGACENAAGACVPHLSAGDGLLLEEFVDGPEISVDSVIHDGVATPVVVARKMLGFPPYFEEIGHLVMPWRHEDWADDVTGVVVAAHRALGIRTGITHTEIRLTAKGPRIIEVNGRLGGDLIPHLGYLATGANLPAAAVALALGGAPEVSITRSGCAAVRFCYPPVDARVTSIEVGEELGEVPWVDRVTLLAGPGTLLRLPPHGMAPRYAAVVVTGDSPQECSERLESACGHLRLDFEPLATATLAS